MTINVIDLFCGCGGMSWGLYKAGFQILAGIDYDDEVLRTFQVNHNESLALKADLTQLDPQELMKKLNLKPGEVDCLIGGPPCQGFSKNVPAAYRFLKDPRNQLFHDFLRFVEALRPNVVIMENVAEIYAAYKGTIREEIIETLNQLGYAVDVHVLYAPDFGVPQRRRRCFFFASRTGISPDFPTPTFRSVETLFEERYITAWEAISDLPALQNGEGYEPMPYIQPPLNDYQKTMRCESPVLFDHVTRKLNDKQLARVAAIQPGEGIKNLPDQLRPKSGYSGAYGRLDFEMIAPTITRWVFHPGSGRFYHPRDNRLITIREAARLQSFSDDFRFQGTYIQKAHQVGNAVPPLLIAGLVPSIKACLRLPTEDQWREQAASVAD